MKIKAWQIIAVVMLAFLVWVGLAKFRPRAASDGTVKVMNPHRGNIQTTVSTTGTVLPKNRLEVKPPVNGRIEQVLVQEGQAIKAGDILVWMSSTDRAALLDAARGQGEDKYNYWKEVYKPIPLTAPINGEVIVGTIQPGQTVTTGDAVVVLSDRLIVRAQVDETDIGKIEEGQKAAVGLDAYPDTKISGIVDHIYHESKTVNNVTVYEVDLATESIPPFFRSGMNANIDFIAESRENVLLLPLSAVQKEKGESFVTIKNGPAEKGVRRVVKLGLTDDKNVEILDGLTEEDEVIVKTKKYSLPQNAGTGSNPFAPQRRRQ